MVETKNSSSSSSSRKHSSAPSNATVAASSLSVKSVLLHTWWLVKNCTNRISVAGLASRERSGPREFISAPISRRIDTTTLETVDGIIITVCGLINRSQTLQNGFPFSVCNDFQLGFPFDWEDRATQFDDEETAERLASNDKSIVDELKNNFDNLPATKISDLVLQMSAESFQGFFCDHIMGKVGNKQAAKSEVDKTARSCKRVKTGPKNNHDDGTTISDTNGVETEAIGGNRGVACRTTHNSKNLNSQNARNRPASAQVSTPEAEKKSSPEVVCAVKGNGKEDKEAGDECLVRRSGRLKIHKSYIGMAD